ncbi:MAG: response regulator [Fimbriimonadaceae bacterium]|jgi:CheY-like chemotaxis protein|nr:response regulator [Fimbriimonadaceae bacterium]
MANRPNKLILLIEDNPADEQSIRRALEKNNVMNEVVVAVDGDQAVELLYHPTEAIEPDLILLDWNLPGLHGREVLGRIRSEQITKTVPVVVASGSTPQSEVRLAYELGANSFIFKPTDAMEFYDTFLTISMYWLLINASGTS